MIEIQKKLKKRRVITEEISSKILQRYPAETVVRLLQEIAQNPGDKLDWNMLVEKTTTGISNAREYQMLWRHLAYQIPLLDNVEDGAQPMDDDSDLECELEAILDVHSDAPSEASACVKVLIASGLPSESNPPNSSTIEAPLTIHLPNQQSLKTSSENSQSLKTSSENSQSPKTPSENSQASGSMQGTFITIPVYVQKQPLPTITAAEVLDRNGSAIGSSIPPRRKRKLWSIEEDDKLKAAVKKFGEGNWTTILKADYMEGRTATQLSQRWANLKKKDGNLDGGDPHLSEAQQATRHAVSIALDGIKIRSETIKGSASSSATPAMASSAGGCSAQGQTQTQKGPVLKKSSSMGKLNSTEKSQLVAKKPLEKSDFGSDSMVRATAVAAGARIATASDAALLMKAAQSKNAVHIKSSQSSGLASTPVLTKVAVVPGTSRPGLLTTASQVVKQNPSSLAKPSGQTATVSSSRSIEPPSKNASPSGQTTTGTSYRAIGPPSKNATPTVQTATVTSRRTIEPPSRSAAPSGQNTTVTSCQAIEPPSRSAAPSGQTTTVTSCREIEPSLKSATPSKNINGISSRAIGPPSKNATPTEQSSTVSYSQATETSSKNECSTMEPNQVAKSGNELKETSLAGGDCAPGNNTTETVEDTTSLPKAESESRNPVDATTNHGSSPNLVKVGRDQPVAMGNKTEKSATEREKTRPSILDGESEATVEPGDRNQNSPEKQADS